MGMGLGWGWEKTGEESGGGDRVQGNISRQRLGSVFSFRNRTCAE